MTIHEGVIRVLQDNSEVQLWLSAMFQLVEPQIHIIIVAIKSPQGHDSFKPIPSRSNQVSKAFLLLSGRSNVNALSLGSLL